MSNYGFETHRPPSLKKNLQKGTCFFLIGVTPERRVSGVGHGFFSHIFPQKSRESSLGLVTCPPSVSVRSAHIASRLKMYLHRHHEMVRPIPPPNPPPSQRAAGRTMHRAVGFHFPAISVELQAHHSGLFFHSLKREPTALSINAQVRNIADVTAAERCHTVWEFDAAFTAPAFGFPSAEAYYRCSGVFF